MGSSLAERLKGAEHIALAQRIEFIASFDDEKALFDNATTLEPDILALEFATLHPG